MAWSPPGGRSAVKCLANFANLTPHASTAKGVKHLANYANLTLPGRYPPIRDNRLANFGSFRSPSNRGPAFKYRT